MTAWGGVVPVVESAVAALASCDVHDFDTVSAAALADVAAAFGVDELGERVAASADDAAGSDPVVDAAERLCAEIAASAGWGEDEAGLLRLFATAVSSAHCRVDAMRRLESARAGQALLNEIAAEFSETASEREQAVLESTVARVQAHLGCCSLALFVLDRDTLEFRCAAETTADGTPLQAPYAPIRRDDPVVARLLDPSSGPEWTFGRLLGMGDDESEMLLFPIVHERDIAVVSAVQRPGTRFASGAGAVLRSLTGVLAQFRSRASLERDAARRSEADRLIGRIAAAFVECTVGDAEEGVLRALERIAETFGLSTVSVWRGADLAGLVPWSVHRADDRGDMVLSPRSKVFDSHVVSALTADPHRVLVFEPGVFAPHPDVANCTVVFAPVVERGVVVGAVSSSDLRPLHLIPDLDVQRDLMTATAQLIRQLWRRLAVDEEITRRLTTEDRLREFTTDLVTGVPGADGSDALGGLCRRFAIDHASMWRIRSTTEGAVAELRLQYGAEQGLRLGEDRARFSMSDLEAATVDRGGDSVQWPFDLSHPLPQRWRELTGFDGERQVGLVSEVGGSKLLFTRPGPDEISTDAMSAMAMALSILSQYEARSVAERAFVSAVHTAPIAISVRDADTTLISCNEAYLVLTGRSESELIGTRPQLVLSQDLVEEYVGEMVNAAPGDAVGGETAYRRPDGSIVWARSRVVVVEVPTQRRPVYFIYSEDITESRRNRRLLEYQATHDELTGLPNRRAFLAEVDLLLEDDEDFAVLLLDLDRFKLVNDSLGHSLGDVLLMRCADRIRLSLRPGDSVARLGGDEFAVLLRVPAGTVVASAVSERLLALLAAPVDLQGREVFPAASIGIAVPEPGGSVEDLIRDADAAMYEAKVQGGNRWACFDRSMRDAVEERIQLESELRRALDGGQFELYYQPEFALDRGRVVGAEALLRWQHPDRGLLGAASFIEVAEETGLVVELGRWVLGEATRQAARWVREGHDIVVRVNLSAHQLRWAVIGEVREALDEAGLTADRLCLELTETALMKDVAQSASILGDFRELGVQIAIDDFGTGFSSLAYLKRFPVDVLKIDRTFVDGLVVDPDDTAIVRSIVGLARTLRLQVVAEGIERPDQIDELLRLGCTRGQGFHLARPMPALDVDFSAIAPVD